MNKKMLMDVSSILGAFLHLKDEEYGVDVVYQDKEYHIPSVVTCEERFQSSFINTLEGVGMKRKDVICVLDPGGECLPRQAILKTYKKRPRVAPPELFELRSEFFTRAIGWMKSGGAVTATPKNRAEADDLINELAMRLPDTLIYSRDKDLLACPTDVLLAGNSTMELNPKKFPVEDKHIPLYRAIVVGDPSDNVKSVPGFGKRTWEKMVDQFGPSVVDDLQGMIDDSAMRELVPHLNAFPKFRLLVDHAEALYLSYKVMKFLPVHSHEVAWEGGVEHGDNTLVTKDNYGDVISFIEKAQFDYAIIDYESDVCDESREWSKTSGVKVDVMGQEIAGMGLRINSSNFYFSVNHAHTNNITIDQLEDVLALLWGYPIYAHNAAFEQTLTYNHFGSMLPHMIDTMLMYSYVDENDYVGLKHLSKKWLGYQQSSYMDTLGSKAGMSEISGWEVVTYGIDDVIATDGIKNLAEVILQYEGTLDVFNKVENDALYFTTMCFINGVDFDQKAYNKLKRINDRNIEGSWDKLSDMMLDLHWPGGEFEEVKNLDIVTVNRIYKAANGKDLDDISTVKMAIRMMDDRQLADLVKDKDFDLINKYYKHHWKPVAEFNVRSPKQMCKLLYDVLGVPKRIRNKPTEKMKAENKKGNPASNEAAILNAIEYHDTPHIGLLKLLLKHKGYLTKESLFLSKYPGYVHWKTGRIHASLRQSSTTTRRYSCGAPNLQQLPKRAGKEYRNMLRARDGYSFVALDFTGQELRLAAEDSQDENFLSCYIGDNKKDPHSLTGLGIAQKTDEDITYGAFISSLKAGDGATQEYRTIGKKINFTCQYGAQAAKVAQTLFISETEAQEHMDSRARAFPGLISRVRKWHQICKKNKYATTFLGGRRHLHSKSYYSSKKDPEITAAHRLAYSMRIQGSAAEMTKLVCGSMYEKDLLEDGTVIPVTLIHDEVLVQVKDSEVDKMVPILTEVMCQQYADMVVPLETEPEVGKSFGNLKSWKGGE